MGMGYRRAEFVLNSFVRFVRAAVGRTRRGGARRSGDALVRAHRRSQGHHGGQRVRRRSPAVPVPPPPRSVELRARACAGAGQGIGVPALHLQPRRGAPVTWRGRALIGGAIIWGAMLRTLILVLYCTGMRLGEAVRLRMADVDLDRGTLMIRHSKGRSRIVADPRRPGHRVASLRRAQRQRLVSERRRADPQACVPAAGRLAADRQVGIGCDPAAAARARNEAASAGGSGRARTSSGTPSPCIGSRPGRTRAWTSMPSCRGCRPTSAT